MANICSVWSRADGSDHPVAALQIIIVNWNAGDHLRRCVDSVFASRLDGLVLDRLAVVDNASSDGSADHLTGTGPPLEIIRNCRNLGFATACNLGAAAATADYLLFLNPDTLLDETTLADAVSFMDDNPDIGISGIRLRDRHGVTQRSCARFPKPAAMIAQSLGLDRLLPKHFPSHFLVDWDHQDSRDVPQVIGAFLLIRRSLFVKLGGFDERFFLYYEDVDLCYRAALAGSRVFHNAATSAVHVGGGTTTAIKARRQYLGARSRIQYAAKHYGLAQAILVAASAVVLEPLARLARGAARGAPGEMQDTLDGALMLAGEGLGLTPGPWAGGGILALTRYPRQGASSRMRFLVYLAALKAAGLAVTVSPFFGEGYLPDLYAGRRINGLALLGAYGRRLRQLWQSRFYELVWIEKEALPWLPAWAETFLTGGRPVILDYDDAWFRRYAAHGHPFVRSLLGRKLEELVSQADTTVVGNGYLSQWAGMAGARRVVELPTGVDIGRYQTAPFRPQGPLRIVWIGTPSTAEDYLSWLLPVLGTAIGEGWASLTVIGSQSPQLAAIGASFLPWSETEEAANLAACDVGIMPLTDSVWSRGKCAYKLIQYMAAGLPVVASPVGMNLEVVHPGINGFLATEPEQWLKALRTLADDPHLRRRLGLAGRHLVEERYSLEVLAPRLLAVFKALQ